MIYTLTLNPAIDYVAHVDELKIGQIGRSHNESVFFGGKGINVSSVLHEHGVATTAMGFIAGFTGAALEDGLKNKGIACDFVHLKDGFTRINIKLRSKEETDINGEGPRIAAGDIKRLYEKLNALQNGDTLVLAGSIPSALEQDMYEQIMKAQHGKDVRFVVDATGELLMNTLKYRPFLIKPNNDELGELFSVKISTPEEALEYAAKLQEKGARNVLASMAGAGAVLLDETGRTHFRPAYSGKAVNTVGAGDSMIAGFLAGFEQTEDYSYALKLGSASGSATAFCEGLADIDFINSILQNRAF